MASKPKKTKKFKDTVQTYMGNCSINAQCDSTQSLVCSLTNQTLYACLCATNFYWSSSTSQCTAQLLNNIACTDTIQCRVDLGLYCDTTTTKNCICNSTFYWSSLNKCDKKIQNGLSCAGTLQCDNTIGLQCTGSGTTCACPTTHFYNGTACRNRNLKNCSKINLV